MVAIMVVSVGLFAVAGVGVSVWSQTRAAGRLTDRTLIAQRFLEEATAAGFTGLSETNATVAEGSRVYAVSRSVVYGSRLSTVRVTVQAAESDPGRALATRLSLRRPLPPPP